MKPEQILEGLDNLSRANQADKEVLILPAFPNYMGPRRCERYGCGWRATAADVENFVKWVRKAMNAGAGET